MSSFIQFIALKKLFQGILKKQCLYLFALGLPSIFSGRPKTMCCEYPSNIRLELEGVGIYPSCNKARSCKMSRQNHDSEL